MNRIRNLQGTEQRSVAGTWHCVRGSLPADGTSEQRHTFDFGVATGPRAAKCLFEGEGERAIGNARLLGWFSVDIWGLDPPRDSAEEGTSFAPAGKQTPSSIVGARGCELETPVRSEPTTREIEGIPASKKTAAIDDSPRQNSMLSVDTFSHLPVINNPCCDY